MNVNNFKNLFYSTMAGYICNFSSGLATLYVILFWYPEDILKENDPERLFMLIGILLFVGIIPALSYNIIRLRMVKSGELNYGMFRYTLSTLPFIVPMLIYYIAWLRGFRME